MYIYIDVGRTILAPHTARMQYKYGLTMSSTKNNNYEFSIGFDFHVFFLVANYIGPKGGKNTFTNFSLKRGRGDFDEVCPRMRRDNSHTTNMI